jgi:pimeloyl-ACP methyl ester carboxylesterase
VAERSDNTPSRSVKSLEAAEVHPVETSDGTEVRLTHYALGSKGPVVLAPGYANTAQVYALDTLAQNFVQVLGENDYDVWLLDYRASPALPSAGAQFTADDIATRDWPATIRMIRQETGAESVQVLGHSVGGLSLFMALGAGLEGVRSAIFSGLAGHLVATPANRLRAWMRLATALRLVGIEKLTTDYERRLKIDRVVDLAMRMRPFEPCDSPVCRRIRFIYGDLFDHANLDAPTHDALGGVFGIGNITFFEHIARMIRAGHAVTADGRDAYLANLDRFRLPITFVAYERDRTFMPRSIELTYELLTRANGPGLYRRHVIPGYGHLDCWLGARSHRDVFPIVLAELEQYA